MSDQTKLEILRTISEQSTPGKQERFSFYTIGKNLSLRKDEVDAILVELFKEKYVAQYAKKGVDSFVVEIKQKGLDAVEDGSFPS